MFEDLWIPPKGLSIERLETLVRVDAAGSIADAAFRNPTRQSQMSRQLRELGEALGTPLTSKKGRGAHLTLAGRQLATMARGFLKTLGALKDTLSDGKRTVVTLGAGDIVLQSILVPAIASVAARHPGLEVNIRALVDEQLLPELDRETLDAVVVRHKPPRRWVQHKVTDQSYALYVPSRFAGNAPEEVLRQVPLALQTSDAVLLDRVVESRGEQLVALRCETFAQAREALRSGIYATVLPTFMDLSFQRREARRIEWPTINRKGDGLWWAQPRHLENERPIVAKVLSLIRERCTALSRDHQ